MLDGVLVESIGTHAVFGREQAKIFAGNKPVKRTVLAADWAITRYDFLKIAFSFERDLPTVTATFVNHWTVPFDDFALGQLQRPGSALRDERKPRLNLAFDLDGLEEHGMRADPPACVWVQRAIHNQRFQWLTVPRDSKDFVLASLVVAVASWLCVG
jgi:hypothetical protein